MTQIERILSYEKKFDKVQAAINNFNEAMKELTSLQETVQELDTYYKGDLWKKDFLDDENGKFPADLKRGILSDDGFFNLLDDYHELLKKVHNLTLS
jgi:hypothetical protein